MRRRKKVRNWEGVGKLTSLVPPGQLSEEAPDLSTWGYLTQKRFKRMPMVHGDTRGTYDQSLAWVDDLAV